jgi:hypothetical protein
MRILFLTDSLSLPRVNEEEIVLYEDTYLYKLREEFKESLIVDSAIGGATIKDLYAQVFYYKSFNPDIVVLQTGIVDCAPRAYKKFEKKILVKLGLNSKLKGLTRFLRKNRGYTLTKSNKFDYYLSLIEKSFENIPLYSLGILNASDNYESKVPGIKENIEAYNSILEKHTTYINNTDIPFNGIMKDHHHLNLKGHDLIYQKLSIIVKNVSNE